MVILPGRSSQPSTYWECVNDSQESLRSRCRPLSSDDVKQTLVEDLVLALNYLRKWSHIVPEDC